MIIKLIIIAVMGLILMALISGLIFLVRDNKGSSKRTVKALTWRVSLSLLLFIFLFLAYKQQWIVPHGIG